MKSVPHEKCWAKTTRDGLPGINVEQHNRTTGLVAETLAGQFSESMFKSLGVDRVPVLAALHDVGKVAPGFLKKCPAWLNQHGFKPPDMAGMEEDHGKISQTSIFEALGKSSRLRFWAAVVGAHHGKLKGDRVQPRADGGAEWEAERQRLIQAMIAEFGNLPDQPPRSFNCAELWFAAGMITVADWLASDERTFPADQPMSRDEIAGRVEGLVDGVGLCAGKVASGLDFQRLFPFDANELQRVLLQAAKRPGVYVVEASMGTGKTEAALAAAYTMLAEHKARGVYFALPTQATSNRIYERFARFVEKIDPASVPRLIHGSSWLNDNVVTVEDLQPWSRQHQGADWFASSRRALLAPFGVGTVDQALLGVLAVKHFFVRQFALAGKVVILDEVHSYDMYTGTLIDLLVRRLRELQATVIILSATLTKSRRIELTGQEASMDQASITDYYPLITVCDEDGVRELAVPAGEDKRVAVGMADSDVLLGKALQAAELGACVLWIRNTVQDAQDLYCRFVGEKRQGGPGIGLLHARYPHFQRENIERAWMDALGKGDEKRPNGCILISTQIAEQSVDIDADLLITEIAPTDMLLQRIGRLWRHDRVRPAVCTGPEVWLMKPGLDSRQLLDACEGDILAAFGKSARVYAPYVLLRTMLLWSGRNELRLPEDIRGLIEETYRDTPDEPAAWRALKGRLIANKEIMAGKALRQSNPWQVQLDDTEEVRTRWNSCPTVNLFLIRQIVAWDEERGTELVMLDGAMCRMNTDGYDIRSARSLHRNLVRVPRWSVVDILRKQRFPFWSRPYLRGEAILVRVADGKVVTCPDGESIGLCYRDDLGIVVPDRAQRDSRNIRTCEEENESYDW